MNAAAAVGEGVLAGLLLLTALWVVRQGHRATTPGARVLAWAIAATCALSTAPAFQRMGVGASEAGWLPESATAFLWGPWETTQVVVALGVHVWVAWVLVRFLGPLGSPYARGQAPRRCRAASLAATSPTGRGLIARTSARQPPAHPADGPAEATVG